MDEPGTLQALTLGDAGEVLTLQRASFYCANIVAVLWADAVTNRLEGLAIYLLSDELPEVAEDARAAARRLADRIGDLGCGVTGDPRQLLDRAPGDTEGLHLAKPGFPVADRAALGPARLSRSTGVRCY